MIKIAVVLEACKEGDSASMSPLSQVASAKVNRLMR